jgi:signal transduction histidine kinase
MSLTVRDNGPGIDPAELPHVFDKYHRPAASTTEGSGLGLFIVKAVVEAQGGTINVVSNVAEGTTVTVCLPIAAPDKAPVVRTVPNPRPATAPIVAERLSA